MTAANVAVLVLVLLVPQQVPSVGGVEGERSWSKVMYLGGAAGVRGKSMVWQNMLTISARAIRLSYKDAVVFELAPSCVGAITYSGHRHANDDAAVAFLAGPLAGLVAMALAGKSTDHYVTLEYTLADGTRSGVLLRLHKDNYEEILAALHKVTGIVRVR